MNTVDYPIIADQLRASIENIFYHLGLQFGEVVKSNTYSALAQKQQAYSGESFVEQMEKNVIYMDVLTMQMEETAASYLCTGQPLLHPQEVAGYINSTCILPALKIVPLHLKFIREGCTGCEVHHQHGRYSRLAEIRLSGDRSKYVETLEQSYVGGNALQQTTEIFLRVLLENHQFSGIAKHITHHDTLGVINNRTRIHSSLWLGHFEVRGS